MKINNYISSTGLCSRRAADELIKQGKVKINGKKATIGLSVGPQDKVQVNGKLLKPKSSFVYIALNKPTGITSTTEGHIKGNIIDFVNHPERIFPIGRLDKDSEGLIRKAKALTTVSYGYRNFERFKNRYLIICRQMIPISEDTFSYKKAS